MSKNVGREVFKTVTGVGIGVGLTKLAAKVNSGLLGSVANVFITSAVFRGANAVTEVVADKILSKKNKRDDTE